MRQWILVLVLGIGFIAAAIAVSADGSDDRGNVAPEFDDIGWCRAAGAVQRCGGILDLEAENASPDDLTNLALALEEAQLIAPPDLLAPIARLLDLVHLTIGALDDSTIADALPLALTPTDQPRVEAAVAELNAAIVECGHPPLT